MQGYVDPYMATHRRRKLLREMHDHGSQIMAQARAASLRAETLIEPGALENRLRMLMTGQRREIDALHDKYLRVDQDLQRVVRQMGIVFSEDRRWATVEKVALQKEIARRTIALADLQRSLHAAADCKDLVLQTELAAALVEQISADVALGLGEMQMDLSGSHDLTDTFGRLLQIIPRRWCDNLSGVHVRLEYGPRSTLWIEPGGCVMTCDGSDRQMTHLIAHLIELTQPELRKSLRDQLKRRRAQMQMPMPMHLPTAAGPQDLARSRWHRHFWNLAGPGELIAVFCEELAGQRLIELDDALMAHLITLWLYA